jgi:hypothetical protein
VNLLADFGHLLDSDRSYGFISLAQRLDSFEERVEFQRRLRDVEQGEGDGGLRALQERYDALPLVPFPEVPEPPSSGVRLSGGYYGARDGLFVRHCSICHAPGHNLRTCAVGRGDFLPLHAVSRAR